MIPATAYKDQTLAVFGLGITGIGTARSLMEGGANVKAWDDAEAARLNALEAGIPVTDLKSLNWNTLDALVLAPGVPLTYPEPAWPVKLANASNTRIIGDTEIFFQEKKHLSSKAGIIGITGTNGKSTTTALIAHILENCGFKTRMGGNIGRAVLDLEPFEDDAFYVLELSSYQLDLTPSPNLDIAVLINITPDHIDRHGNFENYCASKTRIFENVPEDGLSVAALSTSTSKEIFSSLKTPSTKTAIGQLHELTGFEGAGILITQNQTLHPIEDCQDVKKISSGTSLSGISIAGIDSLRGIHNAENAGIALAIARHSDIPDSEFLGAARTYQSLPHRLQQVGRIDDIVFINDSKATNAEATVHALRAFDNIYWIAGGLAKDGGIETLADDWQKVTKAFLIGEAAANFSHTLAGRIDHQISDTVEQALIDIWQEIQDKGEKQAAILLSPACASFDQFPNFMKRGEVFTKAVDQLIQGQSRQSGPAS